MPTNQGQQVHNEGQVRHFFQPGGARPSAEFLYAGVNGDYMFIPQVTIPSRKGDISPISIQDPFQQNSWLQIGEESSAPDFATFDATFMPRKGGVPRELVGDLEDCDPTFYQTMTDCADPSDLMTAKTDYVAILSRCHHTSKTQAGGGGQSGAAISHTLSYKPRRLYLVGGLYFGATAATEVTREIVDLTYGNKVQCGACGPSDNGARLWYAVMINDDGEPGAPMSVIYSVGGAIDTSAITGAANDDVPVAIRTAGNYLIVAFRDATGGGYFLANINTYTGAPENWQKITTGFVTGGETNDCWVRNAREVFFVGDGGYIYKSTNLAGGVRVLDAGDVTTEDILRIRGLNDTVVAGARNGVVLVSSNAGRTFAEVATAPGSDDVTAVEVVAPLLFWIGTDAGDVQYTENLGNTWVTAVMPATATAIDDISFVNDECGYVLASAAGPAGLLFATLNGGELWGQAGATWRLNNYPTVDRGNRLAYPHVSNLSVATNRLLVGGLAGDGTDGFVAEAVTNYV